MLYKIETILKIPKYVKVVEWIKVLLLTGSSQILIQLISVVSGIIVIRTLSIQEYAYYTLSNNVLGAMTILSNGGIVSGVMAEGGKVWDDKEKLGTVVKTGMYLRKRFAIWSLLITSSVLIYLLRQNHAYWSTSFILVLTLMPAFLSNLSSSMLEIGPKLNQDILSLQKNQIATNLGRLTLLLASVFIFPYSFVALLSDGIPRTIANLSLKNISKKFINLESNKNSAVQKRILSNVKKVLPIDIYNIFSAQITVWILSLTGITSSIAQIGALFRVAAILNIFNVVFSTLIIPRYSRLRNDKYLQRKRMIEIQILLALVCISIIGSVWLLSKNIVWLLGDQYKNLEFELILTIIIFSLNFFSNAIYAICTSKSWSINPFILISINLLAIVSGIYIFGMNTLREVLIFNVYISTIMLSMHIVYSLNRVSK
ncbi:lipopolysaccharide biosynthesis protein [Spirosoma sp. KUDC1026]|uniref:lipopolysaccharide biosynthesis protein n=1 Tax=Spirosoma sp. KUDC1026 TaxID=2745947 RepID=UPI00159BED41|nr:polysaccharide biosynthesis protein [Spirosoma sp. KUDC1026]QKZ15436.1 polysaccharide biosynthesis protein [Spirosoma sp. KUDC1026]